MKIQTRLSLLHSTLFASLFIAIGLILFFLYTRFVQQTIYKQLEQSAFITALFYLEEDELNPEDFHQVTLQFYEDVTNTYYQVYNERNEIRYGDRNDSIEAGLLNQIRLQQKLRFDTDDFYCYGLFYEDNEGDFVVIAKENKKTLYSQLRILAVLLLVSFLSGTVLIILLSRWGASYAYRPFRQVMQEVRSISLSQKASLQIPSPHTHDELEELIETFNGLLARIAESMTIQHNFAKYVTHEFKTPLAAIIGHLEVFALKKRSPDEYRSMAYKLIEEVNGLNDILNTLLIISDLQEEEHHSDSTYRIDELLWTILAQVKPSYPQTEIKVNLRVPPTQERLLWISTPKTQLMMALLNLVENALKYSPSDKTVCIKLWNTNGQLALSIEDQGIGIPPEQIQHLSKPFFRADNSNRKQGSGIGLSIALRILEKNKLTYHINSRPNQGTQVTLLFPKP